MRFDGILRSWNDERGFGFIAPTRGGAELFVHVSAFARDGTRPVAGEAVTFELGRGQDGRPQAVHVIRTAVGASAGAAYRRPAPPSRREAGGGTSWLGKLVGVLVVMAVAYWGHGRYQAASQRRALEQLPPVGVPESPATGAGMRCDGRTHCTQMTSCAEATWFINHCPGTQMDGNHDGVPCEQQWCTGPGAR